MSVGNGTKATCSSSSSPPPLLGNGVRLHTPAARQKWPSRRRRWFGIHGSGKAEAACEAFRQKLQRQRRGERISCEDVTGCACERHSWSVGRCNRSVRRASAPRPHRALSQRAKPAGILALVGPACVLVRNSAPQPERRWPLAAQWTGRRSCNRWTFGFVRMVPAVSGRRFGANNKLQLKFIRSAEGSFLIAQLAAAGRSAATPLAAAVAADAAAATAVAACDSLAHWSPNCVYSNRAQHRTHFPPAANSSPPSLKLNNLNIFFCSTNVINIKTSTHTLTNYKHIKRGH